MLHELAVTAPLSKKRGIEMKVSLWSSLLCISLLAACQQTATQPESSAQSVTSFSTVESTSQSQEAVATEADSSQSAFAYQYTEDDLNDQWDANATQIELQDTTATVNGSGVIVADNQITITQAGTYVLSGSFQGQVRVVATTSDVVHLVLNNAQVTNNSGAALMVEQANKAIVTVASNTDNRLSDAAHAELDTETAAVVSRTDLVFNGNGTLHVEGNHQGGLYSDASLILVSGVYDVTAVADALEGKSAVVVRTADVVASAGQDGIVASNDSEAGKGYVLIENGSFQLTTVGDGIQSETATELYGGTFDVTTTGDTSADVSAKGIKSAGTVLIAAGDVSIMATDDGVNADGNVTISGGQITISSGDDGVHSDKRLTISGGTLAIIDSVEGVEGVEVIVTGGDTSIVSSDDGVNAAGGEVTGSTGSQPGAQLSTSSGNLLIHGGTIRIESAADGIDANGNIDMTGGTVFISGPTLSGNGVLDFDGTFTLTGGELWAAGVADMAQLPTSSTTTQVTVATVVPTQAAHTELIVTDGQGQEVGRFTPTVSYGYVLLSSPAFKQGQTYTLSTASGTLATVTATQVVNGSSAGAGGPGSRP